MSEVTRIEPQPWMTEAATRAVLAALTAAGAEARFVGGCVRDALLGRSIGDIDIATPTRPEEVARLLRTARIKVVPTGLQHGTVTAVLPPRHFEITTLRRDAETFGRHARVEFTDDWAADASRRDFTMNALFLDGEGRVFDPVGGRGDLRAGHVRFVGEAEARIREDVLRLLRFYRFYAHYGKGGADPAARAACRALAPLVPGLSGERIAAETLKLLASPDPVPTLRLMIEDGVLQIVLPEAQRIDLLAALVALDEERDAVLRLGALLVPEETAALAVASRLRLSSEMRDRLVALAAPPWLVELDGDARAQRRALRRLGLPLYRDLVRLAAAGSGKATAARELLAAAPERIPPDFPLKGRDLTALGVPAGRKVGSVLRAVEAWWEEGDYRADRDACVARAREIAGLSPP
jgi:poly(A) polymerase